MTRRDELANTMTTPPAIGHLIGYARVSTHEQTLNPQVDALKAAGCRKIFHDMASGVKTDRPGLDEALAFLDAGDTLVVWRLDRLGRSLGHLIEVVAALDARGVGFRSLQDPIDTTTSSGKLVFQIFGALAEFERNLIRERTRAGLDAARARGKKGGRRPKLSAAQVKLLYQMYDEKQRTVKEICGILAISRTALYKYLERRDPGARDGT